MRKVGVSKDFYSYKNRMYFSLYSSDYIISTEEEEDIFDSEKCIVNDVDRKVNLNYDKKVVEFWKSGKNVPRLSLYRKIVGRLNPCSSYISLKIKNLVEYLLEFKLNK